MKHSFFNKKNYLWTTFIVTLVSINLAGYLGAYILTNYHDRTLFGLGYLRPGNNKTPSSLKLAYTSIRLKINQQECLDTWLIKSSALKPKGTIILFHGKNSTKSSLLTSAQIFNQLGYTTLLVDFRGSGGSSGSVTTVGVKESKDVTLVTNYIKNLYPEQPIILYGISMGSAAILRAIAKDNIQVEGIILELPFSTLLSAVKNRLTKSQIPSFPLGELIVFWGGIQHGFNGFTHNPINYAQQINCPTLILQGQQDLTVDQKAIDNLYQNINAPKKIVSFSNAKHESLVTLNQNLWRENIKAFLADLN